MTNQELIDSYMNSVALLSKETIKGRLCFLNAWARDIKKLFTELTAQDLRNYIIEKKESGKWSKATTIAQKIILFKLFFKFLINENLMRAEDNPTKNLKSPKINNEGELRTLNTQEIRALLKTVESPIIDLQQKLIFYLALTSGMRTSEICSIKRENLDLAKRLVFLPKEDTKGQYRERYAPISDRTKELLEIYIIKHPARNGYLLENRFGKRFSRRTIYNAIRTVIDIAYPHKGEWKKPCGGHVARHTFASRWIESGGDWHALRAVMGWRSFAQFDRYVNVSPDFISRTAIKVEKKLLKV